MPSNANVDTAAWRRVLSHVKSGGSAEDAAAMIQEEYSTACARVSKLSLVRRSLQKSRRRHDKSVAQLLRPSRRDMIECKQKKRVSLERKNVKSTIVDALPMWNEALKILDNPMAAGTYDLILALLLVTGRRQTEILNGRSRFVGVARMPHVVTFHGQLKRRTGAGGYRMPILCSVKVLQRGLKTLRGRQPADTSEVENRHISQTYSSGLRQHLLKHDVFGGLHRLHDLRGAYALMVYEWFDCGDASRAMVTMRILGEGTLRESLPYMTYKFKGTQTAPVSFGRFQISR